MKLKLLIVALMGLGCYAIANKPVLPDAQKGLRLEQIQTDRVTKTTVPQNPGANWFVEQTELPDYASRN